MLRLKYNCNAWNNGITLYDNNGGEYSIVPTSGDAETVWFRIKKSSVSYDCIYVDKNLVHDINLIMKHLRRGTYEKFLHKLKKAL